MKSPVHCVWFKRDLRVSDHAPLVEASRMGRVLPLYIIEPNILLAPDSDALHFRFIREALIALRGDLEALGQPLVVRTGDAVEVLESLRREFNITDLWSHQETGNALTYRRDVAVAAWAKTNRILWTEIPQNGVIRGLRSRSGWAKKWDTRMRDKPLTAPERLIPCNDVVPGSIPDCHELSLHDAAPRNHGLLQHAGERDAHTTLISFLNGRGKNYRRAMSSPAEGADACSRVSAHLAWGCLSIRQAVHAATDAMNSHDPQIPKTATRSFIGRLHWHCHFIQKLESEPAIEFHAFHGACESMRDEKPADAEHRLQAWSEGQTGYPFVDACMRSLRATGWLNFRMRAMLVSFAAYDLWLDWRIFKDILARHFLDYEPGIHISQVQMQSGTTGINTLRIYNPVKQGLDFDRNGDFIRHWVPELRDIQSNLIHTPWLSPKVAKNYPPPVVDHAAAVRLARAKISEIRKTKTFREESQRVFLEHGSRKSSSTAHEAKIRASGKDLPLKKRLPKPSKSGSANQLEIPFL